MDAVARKLPFVAAILLVGCSASTAGLAPLEWQKVAGPGPGGSVLGLGTAGGFDERGNFTVRAFKDGDVYRLYYGGTETRGSILDNGAADKFDAYLTYRPFVLKDGTTYRMWYNGSTKPFNCPNGVLADNRRIGYAESPDGVIWTRFYDGPGLGGSVLPLGAPGSIDAQQVGYVWVLKDGAEYKMYYSANDAQNFWRVALAVSTDARTWTKVPGKLAGGAILDIGPAGSFDVAC